MATAIVTNPAHRAHDDAEHVEQAARLQIDLLLRHVKHHPPFQSLCGGWM
jgi:hypothetical protein